MIEDWLQQIINEDKYGLLDTKPIVEPRTEEERTVIGFEEINNFVHKYGTEPKDNPSDIIEKQLFMRLKGIRNNPELSKQLKSIDVHNLLSTQIENLGPATLDEIINSDNFGMLNTDPEHDIFTIKHGSPRSVGTFDHVAKQKKCKDFDKFEAIFKTCHDDLKHNRRRLLKFANEGSIKPGAMFVLRGMLLYIAEIGDFAYRNHRQQARTRCIYENGTESDILRNSLAKVMYSEGQIVSEDIEKTFTGLSNVTDSDEQSGYIYILKSLSKDPQVKSIPNLYKIGWSGTSVEERVKNAENEPTYLMAKVQIIATYQTYNMNTQKFEDLIHKFFKSAQVLIDVTDNNGTRCCPHEWFSVPLGIINQAIALLGSGEIINYKYDKNLEKIVNL